jgi:hypothetical protein
MADEHVRRDLLLKTTFEILRDIGTKMSRPQAMGEVRRRQDQGAGFLPASYRVLNVDGTIAVHKRGHRVRREWPGQPRATPDCQPSRLTPANTPRSRAASAGACRASSATTWTTRGRCRSAPTSSGWSAARPPQSCSPRPPERASPERASPERASPAHPVDHLSHVTHPAMTPESSPASFQASRTSRSLRAKASGCPG